MGSFSYLCSLGLPVLREHGISQLATSSVDASDKSSMAAFATTGNAASQERTDRAAGKFSCNEEAAAAAAQLLNEQLAKPGGSECVSIRSESMPLVPGAFILRNALTAHEVDMLARAVRMSHEGQARRTLEEQRRDSQHHRA